MTRPGAPISPLVWLGAPMAAVFAASLVLAVPLRAFDLQLPEPAFALIPAFAWAMARPSVVAPFALIVLGGGLDLLWGGPLGLWPMCLLCAYALVFCARRIVAGQDFLALWAWYAAACATAMTAGLILVSLRSGRVPGLAGVGLQFAVTAAMFPFAWRLIERYEASDQRYQ
jgi:rod shape-determining protein MreD